VLRLFNDTPYLTDSQNYILDTRFPPINNPEELAAQIKGIVGVVEHGMFINMVRHVVIADPNGAYELEQPTGY
jgi:ribose 5-phosphate isomerase A